MFKKIDTEVLRTIAAQPLALITPLLIFRFTSVNWGANYLIEVEALLSLTSFLLIIIDFSSTTFFSRNLRRIAQSGLMTTVIAARLALSVTTGTIAALTCLWLGYSSEFSFNLIIVLISFVFDFSWYFLGSGRSHFIPVVLAARSVSTYLFLLSGIHPVMAVGCGYISMSIVQAIFISKELAFSKSISIPFLKICFSRYRYPTLSELLTAVFSRLDAFFASILLAPMEAVGYLTIRKYVLASATVALAGMRLLYVRAASDSFNSANRTYVLFAFAAVVGGGLAAPMALQFLAGDAYQSDWIVATFVLLLILPVGYYKNRITFSIFYIKRAYKEDLFCVVASNFLFLLALVLLEGVGKVGLLAFAGIRLGADLTYLAVAQRYIARQRDAWRK